MAAGGRGGAGGVGGAVSTAGAGGKPAAGGGGAGGGGYEEFPAYVCTTIQAEPPGVEGQGPAAGSGGASGGSGGAGAGGARAAGAGGAGAGGASAASGGAAAGGGVAATFADVHELLSCEGCNNSFCHGSAAGFNINGLGRTEFYELLVGKDGKGGPAGTMAEGGLCEGKKRVVPGDPENSLLYLKLANRAPCGEAGMPIPGATRMESGLFNPRQLEVVRSWIAAGAKKDGM